MPTLADLQPGDIAFGPIHGAAGAVVAAGQIAVAPWKHQLTWRTWWRVRHVGVITQRFEVTPPELRVDHRLGSGPMMAQAMPGGAERIELGPEHWTSEWTYIRPRYAATAVVEFNTAQAVATAARTMADRRIPYNWLDYAAILLHRLHLPTSRLNTFVEWKGLDGVPQRAICSQLADAALSLAGFNVFSDGRAYGDVVPSELYLRLLELGPELIIRPGVRTEGTIHESRSEFGVRVSHQGGRYSMDHWL